jgi:hypothetical protein
MKAKYIKTLLITGMLITGSQLLAQGPPNPPGNPNSGGGPVGGSAPITGGIEMLLVMGLAYGSKKVYTFWKDKNEKLED